MDLKVYCHLYWIFVYTVVVNGECLLGGGEGHIEITNRWTGTISSPSYGSPTYPPNQDCSWVIKVPRGNRIRLTFTEFDIEDGEIIGSTGEQLTCRDYLQVHDISGDDGILERQCGQNINQPVIETFSNEVSITFHTDKNQGFRGFKIQYEGICENKVELVAQKPWILTIPPITVPSIRCRWEVTTESVYRPRIKVSENPSILPICDLSTFEVIDGNKTSIICEKNTEVIAETTNLTLLYYIQTDPTNGIDFEFSTIELAHCINDTCLNGGTCIDSPSSTGYRCVCLAEFKGKRCEEYVDLCASGPCVNGTCVGKAEGGFTCICSSGIKGVLCDTDINECLLDPCANDGKCQNVYGDFNCKCRDGFAGRICEDILDPCLFHKCQNNATCISKLGDYECECLDGFYGDKCSNFDFCVSDPCLNGGLCSRSANGYTCTCVSGFEGDNCEINVNECISFPCEHNSKCIDAVNHFTCECAGDYIGTLCSDYKYKDMAHCSEETDTNVVSGLHWFHTRVGEVRVRSCPPGITGQASRLCKKDDSAKTRGVWGRPDLTNCVNPVFLEIANQTEELLKVETITVDDLNALTSSLGNFTRTSNLSTSNKLYPGDITVASRTIQMISSLVVNLNAEAVDVQETTKGYGKVVGNLVDENTAPVWKITQPNVTLGNVVSLLNSTEEFVTNLIQVTANIGRKKRAIAPTQKQNVLRDISFTAKNVDISISVVEKDLTLLPYFEYGVGSSSSIRIPSSLINMAREASTDNEIAIYRGRFNSLANLLTTEEDDDIGNINLTSGKIIWSDVIAGKLLTSDDLSQDLEEPVILTFAVKNTSGLDAMSDVCGFVNMSSSGLPDVWSTEGCKLTFYNDTHAECHCYHMTNFALLLDVYGTVETIDANNGAALSYISYVGGGLSILVCILTIAVFEFLRLKSERIRIHQQLALSIVGVQCLFLFGIDRTENKDGCKVVAILLHYFLLTLFCWMLAEGIHIYIVLVKVFKTSSHFKKYLALGWGLPFFVVCLSAGIFHEQYGRETVCWLDHEMILEVFVPPAAIIILVNAIILGIVLRTIARSVNFSGKMGSDDRSSAKMALKAAMVLLPLLGLTWSFGFLSVDSNNTLVFTYLFTILNSGQGILFFIFHCVLNPDVQNAYDRRQKWIKRTRKTSLNSSKSPGYDSDYNKTTLHTTLSSKSIENGSYQSGNGHVPLHRSTVSVTFDDYPLIVESKSGAGQQFEGQKCDKNLNGTNNGCLTKDPRSTDTKFPLSPKFSENL